MKSENESIDWRFFSSLLVFSVCLHWQCTTRFMILIFAMYSLSFLSPGSHVPLQSISIFIVMFCLHCDAYFYKWVLWNAVHQEVTLHLNNFRSKLAQPKNQCKFWNFVERSKQHNFYCLTKAYFYGVHLKAATWISKKLCKFQGMQRFNNFF